MENNTENKEVFFAHYWGQKVLSDLTNGDDRILYVIESSNMYRIEESYLELKSLEQITDEDALRCWDNDNYVASTEDIKHVGNLFVEMSQLNVDFLRSKGYAVPYMGLSIETLLDYGWVKIKE